MKVFWRLGEATVADVVAELEGQTDWKPRTIQTLVRRLTQKGALTYEERGREYLYRPTVEEKDCEHAASRSFIDRVFEGKLAPFLATFVEKEDFTSEEIEELKKLLEKGDSAP